MAKNLVKKKSVVLIDNLWNSCDRDMCAMVATVLSENVSKGKVVRLVAEILPEKRK